MKRFVRIFMMMCLVIGGIAAKAQTAQQVYNPPLAVSSVDYVFNASSVGVVPTFTLTNGATDTVRVKVIGGSHQNSAHFYNVGTKVSGSTDSVTVAIYASADTGYATQGEYKLLYSDQTANSAGPQVFEHVVSNDWTNYMIVTRRIGVTAQSMTWKLKVLLR